MIIELTPKEILQAAMSGVMRRTSRLKNKTKDPYGYKQGSEWQWMIEGALSECAFAKYKGIYWQGCGEMNDDDVGDIDVRCTPYANGHLMFHRHDKDDKKYYLLTGKDGTYNVVGWMYGKEGKQEKYLKQMTDRPAEYFVPQSDLHKDGD